MSRRPLMLRVRALTPPRPDGREADAQGVMPQCAYSPQLPRVQQPALTSEAARNSVRWGPKAIVVSVTERNQMRTTLNADLAIAQIPTAYPALGAGMVTSHATVRIFSSGHLYKFASSVAPGTGEPKDLTVAAWSPWWFDEPAMRRLRQFLKLDPNNWGFLARLQAAVKYQWSNMDTLITARVSHPFKAYQGPGVWQTERSAKGGTIIYQAPADLQQTYIPNVDAVTDVNVYVQGTPALVILRRDKVPSGDAIDTLIQNVEPGKVVLLPSNPLLQ
jgi:hypothetical protein